MAVRNPLSLEAQASILVSFLAQAGNVLSIPNALEICTSLASADVPAARFLKAALVNKGIDIKHTACLKALAMMEGYSGHVSRPKPTWQTASYSIPGIYSKPDIRSFQKCSDAVEDLCNRLKVDLSLRAAQGRSPYGALVRTSSYVELTLTGNPFPGACYILALKDEHLLAKQIEDADAAFAAEQLRHVIEDLNSGWLEGVIAAPHFDSATFPSTGLEALVFSHGSKTLVIGSESSVVLEWTDFLSPGVSMEQSLEHPPSGMPVRLAVQQPGKAETRDLGNKVLRSLVKRYRLFQRRADRDFVDFYTKRLDEDWFALTQEVRLDKKHLRELLGGRKLSSPEVATMLGWEPDEWQKVVQEGTLPVEWGRILGERLGVSANEVCRPKSARWKQLRGARAVDSATLKNYLQISASACAADNPLTARMLKEVGELHARQSEMLEEWTRTQKKFSAEKSKLVEALAESLSKAAGEAGLVFAVRERETYLRDLPIERERYAHVFEFCVFDASEDLNPKG